MPQNPQTIFPDVQVKCTDGIVHTHKLALVSVAKYFTTYYGTTFPVSNVPEIPFSCNALNKLLQHGFYRYIQECVDDDAKKEHAVFNYEEIPEIVSCAEFLLIPSGVIMDMASHMIHNGTGPYPVSLTGVIVNYINKISKSFLETIPDKCVLELIWSTTHRTYILERIKHIFPTDRCFSIYEQLDYFNIPDTDIEDDRFYCKLIKHISKSDRFTFIDFKFIYDHAIDLINKGSDRLKYIWNLSVYLYLNKDYSHVGSEYTAISNVMEAIIS